MYKTRILFLIYKANSLAIITCDLKDLILSDLAGFTALVVERTHTSLGEFQDCRSNAKRAVQIND